jgi:hypothetical protein
MTHITQTQKHNSTVENHNPPTLLFTISPHNFYVCVTLTSKQRTNVSCWYIKLKQIQLYMLLTYPLCKISLFCICAFFIQLVWYCSNFVLAILVMDITCYSCLLCVFTTITVIMVANLKVTLSELGAFLILSNFKWTLCFSYPIFQQTCSY